MNVRKEDFVQQYAEKYDCTKKAARELVNNFWELVAENVKNGDTVSFYGYGCFDIIERQARTGTNPRTKEEIQIPAHWTPKFYPGSLLKSAVKMWADNEKRGIS